MTNRRKFKKLTDAEAMNIALKAALESPDPWMKVGCVGLNENKEFVASGYNSILDAKPELMGWRSVEDFMSERTLRRPFMVHAETMMCSYIKKGEIQEVVITLFPCVDCMKLLASHGVKKVTYLEAYDKDKASFRIAQFFGIEVNQYIPSGPQEI